MGVSNGIITAPINMKDPYTCMGVAATADGYNNEYICSNVHGKINKWSKKKPVISNKLEDLTDADRKAAAYGLYFDPSVSSGKINWVYKPPTGGNNSIYRINDFEGYDHNMKSGLQFTSDNYSKDIVKSASGVEVALYTDPNMITLKDFADTLLSGCKVRINVEPYDGQTTYSYQTTYEDISASTLKWTIPREALVKLNVGRSTVNAQIVKSNGVVLNPLIKENTFLTVTADTGVNVTNWSYSMNVGTQIGSMHPASDYQPGVSKYTLDASNGKNIYFSLGAIQNNSGKTISSADVFVQMSYRDANGVDVQKRINLYKGSSLGTWSIVNGSVGADYFGIRHENLPSLPNGTAVMYAIQVNITFDGINGTYTITDTIRMVTKN